jgi:hypothetical protein
MFRKQIIVAGTESGELHIAQIENGQIQVESAEKLSRKDGYAQSSLIYAIR